MKIGDNFLGFGISAKGLSIQRKKMNLIAENLANGNTVRTEDGKPVNRKILTVKQKDMPFNDTFNDMKSTIKLASTNSNHITSPSTFEINTPQKNGLEFNVKDDTTQGDIVYMPEHPDANKDGYVQLSNINTINEMIDMIAATRSYEANLTAFNSSKQMAKDSLEI
ncbi:MAG: flagellar basal body rod protein FlgC [Ignavibacteriaceae bacterium]|nr:flagellar basal body rod protein FlgC [Ignavibacterium sp.]MCC6253436.1 flagellar basal body rod protein FlgC [Ignavibacteriaceae bacterium]HMN22843.1 flagellar basal body rod protein FlgC [Ignavibacteriaceae bacterium]HRN26990.1 flagellar basal body rod protein FlgC [Ignavibacteriaceae bacterium]HRP91994.1 flagellar basal body rod protein FlgC [Ignavibacteriaceae bacterium]